MEPSTGQCQSMSIRTAKRSICVMLIQKGTIKRSTRCGMHEVLGTPSETAPDHSNAGQIYINPRERISVCRSSLQSMEDMRVSFTDTTLNVCRCNTACLFPSLAGVEAPSWIFSPPSLSASNYSIQHIMLQSLQHFASLPRLAKHPTVPRILWLTGSSAGASGRRVCAETVGAEVAREALAKTHEDGSLPVILYVVGGSRFDEHMPEKAALPAYARRQE